MSIYAGITPRGYLTMVLASIGAILFGFDNGWWGTVLGETAFLCDYGSSEIVKGTPTCVLSTSKQSAGTGIGSAGIMIGCAIAMYTNNILGRKKGLMGAAIISILGIIIEMTSAVGSSSRYNQFLVGKIINSIAMGMAANVIPTYLSETSTTDARGFVINMYQAIQIVGVIIASGSVYAVSTRLDKSAYLIPMGVQLVAPGLMLMVGPFIPESPRWLVWRGRHGDAVATANALFKTETNSFDGEDYCNKLEVAYEEEKRLAQSTGWGDLLKQPTMRRMGLAVGIQSLQQAEGSSYMSNYIVSFLVGTGVTNVFPIIMALSVYTSSMGRRPLLIGTSAVCAASLIIVAILTTAYPTPPDSVQKASIALIFIWYFSFGAQGPLIWIITAESAPTRNREKVIGMGVFWGFGVALVIQFVSPYIQDVGYGGIGSKIGFLWGAFSVIMVLYGFFVVPEYKGKSLEQLDYLFEQRVGARRFGSYKFADDLLATDAVEEKILEPYGDSEKALEATTAPEEVKV